MYYLRIIQCHCNRESAFLYGIYEYYLVNNINLAFQRPTVYTTGSYIILLTFVKIVFYLTVVFRLLQQGRVNF